MEDIFQHFVLGGEVLNVSINVDDWSNGGSGGCGGGSFGIFDQLGVVVSLQLFLYLIELTFACTISLLVTSETEFFPDATGPVS